MKPTTVGEKHQADSSAPKPIVVTRTLDNRPIFVLHAEPLGFVANVQILSVPVVVEQQRTGVVFSGTYLLEDLQRLHAALGQLLGKAGE